MRKAILTAIAMIAAASTAFADIVVTASTAAGISPGLALKPDAALNLKAGESVTLYGAGGATEINGPFSGTAASALGGSAEGGSAVAELLQRRKRIRSLAASRSLAVAGSEDPSSMLHLVADQTWCVSGAAPTLYLRAEKRDRIVTLVDANGARHEMLWPKRDHAKAWPTSAPFRAGERYAILIDEVEAPFGLALVQSPASPSVEAFLSAGCAAQADALLPSTD